MKKGLIGVVVLAFVALVCGTAFAATFHEVDIEATLEWTIFDQDGFMPGTSYDAPALAAPDLTITAGPWSAGTDDGDWDYFKYTAEMATIGLHAATSYEIYDLGHDITETQGITVEADMEPLSLDILYTGDEEYGVGGTYDTGLLSIGAKYNSTEAYGVQLEYPIDDFTLTGQYATGRLPGATTAYLVKGAYALTMENATDDSEITLSYMVSDFPFPSFESTTIEAELVDYPVTATTLVGASVSSVETGGVSTTSYTGTSETTLVEGVTFTLEVGKVGAADVTYSGMVGISL
ncbi:hypothetical protein CEE34_05775 [Candidatus Aerophobetes bacterium Ae_b3a]|nr:MAG: hypothetical protein CEE34_05775 [Candidatus Aerophobetes bacterium Ae_b3a]